MHKNTKMALAATFAMSLAGCDAKIDKTFDRGIDGGHLSNLQAGIWIDPNGCHHWIIDDGIEGYLSSRLDPMGKPVCSGNAERSVAYGPFKGGSTVPDP